MPSDSKTANALMSWGSNVASSQRANQDDIPASWKRTDRNQKSTPRRSTTPLASNSSSQMQHLLQEKCNSIAQRLIDEGNELQYCEQILKDNEFEFEKREKELLQALAEIRQNMEKPPSKPIAEEVSLKEEALWHLQSTLKRLVDEEAAQGQAVVALANCVSCSKTTDSQTKQIVLDTASFVKLRVLPLIRDLRDVCLSFQLAAPEQLQFADDKCEIEIAESIAVGATDRPLRVVLQEALNRLLIRCNDLRNSAAQQADALLDETVEHRGECERLSLTVHRAHAAIAQLKEHADTLSSSIVQALNAESILRNELDNKQKQHIALQASLSSLVATKQNHDDAYMTLTSELEALSAEVKKFAGLIQEQSTSKESYIERKQRVEKEVSEVQVAVHTAISSNTGVVDSVRDLSRRTVSLETEVAKLEDTLRRLNEEENTLLVSVQNAHFKTLEVANETSDFNKRQKAGHDEATALSNKIQEIQNAIDSDRLKLTKARVASESEAVRTRSLKVDLESEREKTVQLESVVQMLKDQLLHQKRSPKRPVLSLNNDVGASGSEAVKQQHSTQSNSTGSAQPFVASKLENAVSTAPLAQLLLTDARVPWRVPLEPRHHKQTPSDLARDRLMKTFNL